MSLFNLKIRRWEKGSDVRFYLDGRYVEYRHEWSHADGVYLCRADDGGVKWKHGFRTGPETVTRAERNAYAARSIIDRLGLTGVTFEEWESRYAACLTKGGNFSVRQYEKTLHDLLTYVTAYVIKGQQRRIYRHETRIKSAYA